MKVLLVNKFLHTRGGVETYVLDLGRMLAEDGNEVQYFGMDEPGKLVGNDWGIYAPEIELGGNQRFDRLVKVPATIRSRKNVRLMGGLLNKFEPDVVHFNNIHYHLTPSVIEAAYDYKRSASKAVSLVMTMHDYHSIVPCDGCMNNRTCEICDECVDGRHLRCAVRGCARGGRSKSAVAALEATYWSAHHAYRSLDAVICPSRCMRDKFERTKAFAGKALHIPNFANLERRTYDKSPYALYFGAYNRDKGVCTLLDVAKLHPEIPFKFCGRGPIDIRALELPNVEDLGFNMGERLREIVGRAALAIVPSECLENSPFAVIEALCLGTPVLGADVGGIPELLDQGVTGELFRFRDKVDLEQKLVSLWLDCERLRRYSRNCLAFQPMRPELYLKLLYEAYGMRRAEVG